MSRKERQALKSIRAHASMTLVGAVMLVLIKQNRDLLAKIANISLYWLIGLFFSFLLGACAFAVSSALWKAFIRNKKWKKELLRTD